MSDTTLADGSILLAQASPSTEPAQRTGQVETRAPPQPTGDTSGNQPVTPPTAGSDTVGSDIAESDSAVTGQVPAASDPDVPVLSTDRPTDPSTPLSTEPGTTDPQLNATEPAVAETGQPTGDAANPPPGDGFVDQSVASIESFLIYLEQGGPAIWAISALSVITLAIIIWKIWRFAVTGVWRRERAELAVAHWQSHDDYTALEVADAGKGLRARVAATALRCNLRGWGEDDAREETVRVAKGLLAEARSGLRALELIATVAPLLGLFGTVLGMIAAFQTLQAAGSRADPSALAGGIWEALLTTAAGMAVAIPASAALTWFESVTDRLRLDMEDIATRVFARPDPDPLAMDAAAQAHPAGVHAAG